EARSGFWLELRDGGGSLLFRQAMHHPTASDREVFPEYPSGEIVRIPVPERSGAFTVVIPELAEAENFVLSSRGCDRYGHKSRGSVPASRSMSLGVRELKFVEGSASVVACCEDEIRLDRRF